jgi:hypothetical protein
MNEQKAFDKIKDPCPVPLPDLSLLVSRKITQIEKGNAALRWIVGFGAGKAYVKGTFEISDAKSEKLAIFEADELYAGGAGIGGAGFLDMDDLMRSFGATIAKKTVQWSRGKKLEE